MIEQSFTNDHFDILGEIINISMGRAGSALAKLLDSFVELSVPEVSIIQSREVPSLVSRACKGLQEVYAVRQAFFNHFNGEAIIIFSQRGCRELGELLGFDQHPTQVQRQEVLLDVSNILVGACLNSIAEQLNYASEIGYSAPTILCENNSVHNLFSNHRIPWDIAMFFKIAFRLEKRCFQSHILFFMPEDSILSIKKALDAWLAEL